MEYLIEPSQELPVIGEFDVLVLGGGPAGISAAVAASRAGAQTAIVERYGYLGGLATGGLVILIVGLTDGKQRIVKGFCQETIDRLQEINAAKSIGPHVLFDPESMKLVFDNYVQENNITPFYHCFVSNVIKTENKITGAVIDGKSGRNVIKAKVFVDATGDADLAKYCKVDFDQEDKSNLLPVTLGFRIGGLDIDKVKKFTTENNLKFIELIEDLKIPTNIGGWIETLHTGECWFNISHIPKIDSTKYEDLTLAEIQGRKQTFELLNTFRNNIPGFENGYLIDTAPQMGIRESRRIKGLYRFTKEDAIKTFDDSVARAPDYTGSGKGSVDVPYRCLISNNIDNLIFSGRCISVDHDIFNMFREIPCCMATGQAAGAAAAIATKYPKYQDNIHKISIKDLRNILLDQGAII